MPAVSDHVWSAQNTTPGKIEEALRQLLSERHAENAGYVPARVLNLVCIVDRQWSGEIANRLRGVGRNHPSRTIVCAVEPGRTTIDAIADVASDVHPKPGEFALIRETVVLYVGQGHLASIASIVDPLVVSDLPTMVWAPHGHTEAIDAMRHHAQVVLYDSIDEPEFDEALLRAHQLSRDMRVVDLAWLRGAPWRERIAGAFDPPARRPSVRRISAVNVRHQPDSTVAGLLVVGWLASRLGWRPAKLIGRKGAFTAKLGARSGDVTVTLEPDEELDVRGLAAVTGETSAGVAFSLERGDGGLVATRRDRWGRVDEWTILGASRGEGGILGEGIRVALAPDPTYQPALETACALAP
jgi:glucose-6-phosphate dehydrogenase assembly protein OpcA